VSNLCRLEPERDAVDGPCEGHPPGVDSMDCMSVASSPESYLAELNDAQREAVLST